MPEIEDDQAALNGEEQPAPADSLEVPAEGAVGDARQQGAEDDASLNTSDAEGDLDPLKDVPYSRFSEVNGKFRETEKNYLAALPKAQRYDALEQLFFDKVPGLRETVAAGVPIDRALQDIADASDRQSQIAQQANKTIAEQHALVDAACERGDITEEWANWSKQNITNQAYTRPQIEATEQKQAMARVDTIHKGILKDFPEADEDSVRDYLLVGKFDLARQRAEKQHDKVLKERTAAEARISTAVADYEAAQAKRAGAPQPERGNSRVAEKPNKARDIESMSDADFMKYIAAEGRKTDLARSM